MATYSELRSEADSLTAQIKDINTRIASASDDEKAQLIAERSQLTSRYATVTNGLLETPGPISEQTYVGKDPQTGLNRYYDPVTGKSTIVPDAPTESQQAIYNANNPTQEPAIVQNPADTAGTTNAPGTSQTTGEGATATSPDVNTGSNTGGTDAGGAATDSGAGGTPAGTPADVENREDAVKNDDKPPSSGTQINVDDPNQVNGGGITAAYSPVNVLHGYVNHTYLVTLHALAKEDYQTLILSETKVFKSSNVLISSAGRFNGPERNRNWKEDFFIEDLDVETVIGLDTGFRGTNAVLINFKIIEPNGFTLLERLIRTAADLGFETHHELVYVMQIDFVGYDNDGTPSKIPGTTKYIPIFFNNVKMEITTRGAEYVISATPYNHIALRIMKVSVPINIAVTAATVGEYFTTSRDVEDAEERAKEDAQRTEYRDAIERRFPSVGVPKYAETKSLVTAINRYERQKVKEGTQEFADEFYVSFDREIADALLASDDKKTQVTNTPIADPEKAAAQAAANADARDLRLGQIKREYEQVAASNQALDSLFTFTARTGSRYNFTKLDATLQERMISMAAEYKKLYGEKIVVTSAFRTFEDQARIRGNPASSGANFLVATPGNSKHERGAAVDININQARKADSSGLLAKYGLQRRLGERDPMHIELGPRAGIAQTSPTPPTVTELVNDATKQEINYKVIKTEINAGTNLIDEINRVVRNSSFLLDQVKDPAILNNKTPAQIADEIRALRGTDLKWWKIVPRVELLEYDKKRRTYAKRITYFVKSYTVNSSMIPLTPAHPPVNIVKEYNYIFTGKNVDVFDFKMDMNALYFIPLTASAYKLNSTSRSPDTSIVKGQTLPAFGSSTGIQLPPIHAGSGTETLVANEGSERTGKVAIAADLQDYLLNARGGHLVTLDLSILGDPDFIKQDDIFSGESSDPQNLNGSIPMDTSEVYVRVNFKTPVDYDDETGLSARLEQSMFSGIFRVIKVKNNFSSGLFKQQMTLVRIYPEDIVPDGDRGE